MAQTSLYPGLSPGRVSHEPCTVGEPPLCSLAQGRECFADQESETRREVICPGFHSKNCGRTWLSARLLPPLPWPAWAMQLQVIVDVRLVVVDISASFSFIRSLGATFFLGDDYMFLKPN